MKYLSASHPQTLIIKKSKFIAFLFSYEKQDDFFNALNTVKKQYPKATHYVYAHIHGKNGEYASSSDDGEPAGTAGVIVLQLLRSKQITNVILIVVRFYGGIKLGSAGLAKAYLKASSEVIINSTFHKKFYAQKYQITFPYNLIDEIYYVLDENVIYLDKKYFEKVSFLVAFIKDDIDILDNLKSKIIIEKLDKKEILIDIT